MPHLINAEMQACIDQCNECHNICDETLRHCLEKGGPHAEAGHVTLLQDCMQICRTSADFMLRGSERHEKTCEVCASICEQCAEQCADMADDKQMQKCAKICRQCAESCHEMAGVKA